MIPFFCNFYYKSIFICNKFTPVNKSAAKFYFSFSQNYKIIFFIFFRNNKQLNRYLPFVFNYICKILSKGQQIYLIVIYRIICVYVLYAHLINSKLFHFTIFSQNGEQYNNNIYLLSIIIKNYTSTIILSHI